MLKKSLGFVLFTGLVGTVAFTGCGSVTITAPDAGASDAATTDAASDAAKPSDAAKDVAPPKETSTSCLDETAAASLNPIFTAPVKGQKLCTTKQIDDLMVACFDSKSTQATCDTFKNDTANAACFTCAGGSDKGGPVMPLLSAGGFTIVNVASCAALVLNKPECALPSVNNVICTYATCESCDSSDTKARTACLTASNAGPCASTAVSKDCTDAFTAGKAQSDAVCRGADFTATAKKTIAYLCGDGATPVVDAGTVDAAPADAPAPTDATPG